MLIKPLTFFQKWQELSVKIRDNSLFQLSIILIILISSLTIGARTYDIRYELLNIILHWMDSIITWFFLVELIIRIIAERRWYDFFHYKNGWNWFDTLIVLGSLIPLQEGNFVLLGRLLRLFRVMRLISFIPQLRLLTSALLSALPRIGYVSLMMFIIFYIYATLGSLLFEEINSVLWGDVGTSMLTLFRVVTFEDWTDVMYETMSVYPLSWIFYVSFIFLSAFVFLNMMIGIIINVLEEENEKMNPQTNDQQQFEHSHTLEQKIDRLEHKIDQLNQQLVNRN